MIPEKEHSFFRTLKVNTRVLILRCSSLLIEGAWSQCDQETVLCEKCRHFYTSNHFEIVKQN